jgi:hypothetical protein
MASEGDDAISTLAVEAKKDWMASLLFINRLELLESFACDDNTPGNVLNAEVAARQKTWISENCLIIVLMILCTEDCTSSNT